MRHLTDRTAVITGASRGIGPYIARAVDVLVNNAGVLVIYPYDRLSIDDIERAVRVNLLSAMALARLVLPGMLERGRGHIVNLSSVAGKFGPPCDEVYAATKAGLIGFSESLRAEYRGRGVSASAICPGYVEEAGMYADGLEATGIPAPRWVGRTTPDAVARAVVVAIKRDRPEIIVNSPPVRPLSVLSELSPSLSEWILTRFGAWAPFTKGAEANLKASGRLTGLSDSAGDRAAG